MKKTDDSRKKFIIVLICIAALTLSATGVSVLVKMRTQTMYSKYYSALKCGDIAEDSITASSSFDVIDYAETEKIKDRVVASVIPRYTISMQASHDMLSAFESVRTSGVYNNIVINYSYEVLYKLVTSGFFDWQENSKAVANGSDSVYITNNQTIVPLIETVTQSNLHDWVYANLREFDDRMTDAEIEQALAIVVSCSRVNASYNELETQKARQLASSSVQPVIVPIEKGQVIIEKDRVITQDQLNLLLLVASQDKTSFSDVGAKFLFCLICFSMEAFVLSELLKKEGDHFATYLISMTLAVVISFFATYFFINRLQVVKGNFMGIYLPVMFAPVLIAMMTGKRNLGFISSIMFSTGICVIPGTGIDSFFFSLLAGCACVYTVRFVNRRVDSILQGAVSVAVVALFYIIFSLAGLYVIADIWPQLLSVAAITVTSILLINIVLPVCERLMNLPTVYRLYELAYGDSKLLKMLASEAPGTYNHSSQVSTLAQAAAAEVGANALLAKVGGMYHDIGKIDHPEYFVENQSGENKHEELKSSLSASIIKSHVKVGADKGREAGLPKEIVDIIYQHHGNDVISFFYHEAVKDKDENDDVEMTDYQYNADLPSSKECAIVMLADSVEAAARTIQSPTAAQFEKLINQIVMTKIEHSQLKDSNLTMREIEVVCQSFLKTLNAMYHSRIVYPEDEDEQ